MKWAKARIGAAAVCEARAVGMEDELLVRARERVGRVISEKYRVDGVLGVGSVAAVFAATHRNGHRVAIKMLHREHSNRNDVKARFLREGYLANRVEHPGVVRITDDDVDADGSAYLVMELLTGETVEAAVTAREGRLELEPSLAVADAVLGVLEAAHAVAIVHRDIKPANLFVTREGTLKVLDFGVARLLEGVSMTQTGELWGTAAFMAPEQARGDSSVDHRVDLWAVGAVLFSMLSGRDVHESRNDQLKVAYAATLPSRPLGSVAPEVPQAVCGVVDRALAFDRNLRWQSASEMQAALRASHEYGRLA
jgi:serine/threonine-protein kinase